MPDAIPTVYTTNDPPMADDDQLVAVRIPADVADELTLVTIWLSLQLGHQLPVAALRRALVLGGLARAADILAELKHGSTEVAVRSG